MLTIWVDGTIYRDIRFYNVNDGVVSVEYKEGVLYLYTDNFILEIDEYFY